MITRRAFTYLTLAAAMRVPMARSAPSPLPTLGMRRTVHFTSAQLRDPILGPSDAACTFSLAMRLEDEPVAIRVAFGNDIALDFNVEAVAACMSTSYGDGANPTGDAPWSLLTTNARGADTGDLPGPRGSLRSLVVKGNGGGPRVPALSWTDWTPITYVPPSDGSGRPILFLRASLPPWSVPRCCEPADEFSGSPASLGRGMVARIHLGGDLAAAPGQNANGFGAWGTSPFYCVQYLSRRHGATVLWGGDSHYAGDTTTAGIDAFPLQTCLALSTPDLPVTAANYAWGGTSSLVFMPILDRMLEACRPQFLILQGWTANDGPSVAANEAYYAKVLTLADKARRLGTFPIVATRFSRETLTRNPQELAEADSLRQRELKLASTQMAVIDATTVLDDPGRPGGYRAGLSTDGIHPNTAGHAAVARLLTPALTQLLHQTTAARTA
jgi:hypothetical protein